MKQIAVTLLCVLSALSCCTTRQNSNSHLTPGDLARHEANQDPSRLTETATGDADQTPAGSNSIRAVLNNDYEQTSLDILRQATETIRIVHFSCNQDLVIDKIVDEIVAAHERGVEVSLVFEADVDDNHGRVEEFKKNGIPAKLDTNKKYTHSKLIVVDSKISLFGSTNFSYKSIQQNNETNLLIVHPEVGAYFNSYALKIFEAPSEKPYLKPVSVPEIGVVKTMHDGDYYSTAHPLIQGASERVDLLVYAIHMNPDYPDSDVHRLVAALVEAHKRGVATRVILEISDYNTTLNEMNKASAKALLEGGVDVRFETIKQISHAKLLLVDGHAVVGSNNWGYGGLYLYHEVGCHIDHPATVADFSNYFDEIWAQSKTPQL